MDLVYSIDFNSHSSVNDYVIDEKTCCSLSCKNAIAFSRAKKAESNGEKLDTSYEVCVVDLDKPWVKHGVTEFNCQVSFLRWDPLGVSLLVVTSQGRFGLWKMKDNLLNVWEEVGHVNMEKEEVLVLAWLHNGQQILFNPECRDSIAYNDKFTRARILPSVTHFGKKPVDGWIAVTSTGMVNVGLIPETGSGLVSSQVCLGHVNSRVAQADVAFSSSGQILICTSDGKRSSSVHCYSVQVSLKNDVCSIRCNPSASFFLKRQPDPGIPENHAPRVTRLSFLNKDNADILLACWGTSSHSCIEVWHLVEHTIPLNRIFQTAGVAEFASKTEGWIYKSSFTHNSGLTDIARPKIPLSRSFNMESSSFLSYFACTFRDGAIILVHRQSYQVLYKASMEQLINIKSYLSSEPTEPFEKKLCPSVPHLMSAVQTNSGCGLVGLCESRLYVFRVFNSRDGMLQMVPTFVVLLLEYALYVGYDVWDILLAVRQGMIENIMDRINSNFLKQSSALQELLFQRLLRHRIALYSCLTSGNQRASDCRALITLHYLAVLMRSGLRPKVISPNDKTAAEKLTLLCSHPNSNELDIDQLIKSLETDEYFNDALRKGSDNIQSLQPHLQWVVDFILQLLTASSSHGIYPGASLMKDLSVLTTFRELLIIIRIWSKTVPSSQPNYMTTIHMDPLPVLFRLTTKAWNACKEGTNIEADQTFLEDCRNLSSKVMVPNYRKTFGEEMNSYLAFSQPFPINYHFGEEPDFLFSPRFSHQYDHLDISMDADQKYDCIRHLYLGVHPKERLRECVKCRSVSMRRKPTWTKSDLLKAWELRFSKNCMCGGNWKLQCVTSGK